MMLKYQEFKIYEETINRLAQGLIKISENKKNYISLKFISNDFLLKLIKQVSTFEYRKAKPVVGNSVSQDFEVCFPAPKIGCIEILSNAIENLFIKSTKLIKNPPIQKVQFNDIAIQKYLPYSSGISPHKDHKKYISVIIIVTLSGKSKFYLCQNRDGRNAQVVDDTPGNIVILPATGFKMINNNFVRPIHFVSDITDGRLSIGLRQNIEL
ncbi:hypothetical protein N9V16_00645 [SAR116 cluster bacterium]|jgi:hypothetical protein|nr:hypothetical protein [SAR116 cluster bacterium]|tara:strand:- start:436 stop:1068 length:633 start_codon:yes stop_codon:yes gene_type:complete